MSCIKGSDCCKNSSSEEIPVNMHLLNKLKRKSSSNSIITNKSDKSDDIWNSDSDIDDEKTLNDDIKALKIRHNNKGYLDGITKGKDSGLQKGFDDGYPIGAELGGIIGELIAETVWRYSMGQINSNQKQNILNELKIDKILNSKYFDINLHLSNPYEHPVIKKWLLFFKNLQYPL